MSQVRTDLHWALGNHLDDMKIGEGSLMLTPDYNYMGNDFNKDGKEVIAFIESKCYSVTKTPVDDYNTRVRNLETLLVKQEEYIQNQRITILNEAKYSKQRDEELLERITNLEDDFKGDIGIINDILEQLDPKPPQPTTWTTQEDICFVVREDRMYTGEASFYRHPRNPYHNTDGWNFSIVKIGDHYFQHQSHGDSLYIGPFKVDSHVYIPAGTAGEYITGGPRE